MTRNFKLIGGFWIAEKEIEKRIPHYKKHAESLINTRKFWEKKSEKTWEIEKLLKTIFSDNLLNSLQTSQDSSDHYSSLINNLAKFLVIKDIIDRYYEIWIEEFFIWYNPPYWYEKFGFEFSPNWRFWENEQITSYDTFEKAIKYVHSLKRKDWKPCKIFLTVNFRYYSDLTMPLIEKIIQDWIKAWVDWLIVWNPETLQYLAEIWYKGEIHTSTILVHYNEDAIQYIVDFCKENNLNLTRLILPREVTLSEVEYLTKKFPDIKFEVFGQSDYCRYANWFCLAEHKYFSRDLCWFVLKHWLQVKKTIRYDFKKIVLDENLSDQEKQKLLDNSLNDLEYIFVSQTVVNSNYKNPILEEYIDIFQQKSENENKLKEYANKIAFILKKELILNYYKFIWDWLRPPEDKHNLFIDQVLTLWESIREFIDDKNLINQIEEKLNWIKKIKEKWIKYYKNLVKEKWKFSTEAIYKFNLYNRNSIPIYRFFNQIPNIEVVKIPLRWRDPHVFKLWLKQIDDAIQNPEKYINEWNICLKYFHYDISKFEIYKKKLDEVSK